MKHSLDFSILPQPTDSTCGPTCLHAVYNYWDDAISLDQTIAEIGTLSKGGTLAVQLACHALQRGYDATIHTFNVQMFDPSWFSADGEVDLAAKLRQQRDQKLAQTNRGRDDQERLQFATESYLRFLALGGKLTMPVLEEELIIESLTLGVPMLCGLSATFLYREPRERPTTPDIAGISSIVDDVGGDAVGHFVVLHGYDQARREVSVADPLLPNPLSPTHNYVAPLTRVAAAILLGVVTYDANLLTLIPESRQ
jgi:hypothetical protein